MSESGPEDERLQAIYDRLDELDPTTFESDASKLLHGLGFEEKMMAKATKDMSGASPPCFASLSGFPCLHDAVPALQDDLRCAAEPMCLLPQTGTQAASLRMIICAV